MLGDFEGAWDVDKDDCRGCVLPENGGVHRDTITVYKSKIGVYKCNGKAIQRSTVTKTKTVEMRWQTNDLRSKILR